MLIYYCVIVIRCSLVLQYFGDASVRYKYSHNCQKMLQFGLLVNVTWEVLAKILFLVVICDIVCWEVNDFHFDVVLHVHIVN